jgi:homoserine kinase
LEDHLILNTYREVLEAEKKEVIPLSLRVRNDIPIGKGCGSSAAARLAGIALANHFGPWAGRRAQIVGEASHREHHPDNASACWMGGLTVARMSANPSPGISASPEREVAAAAGRSGRQACRRRSPPRAPGAVFARRCRGQHPEFHVIARRPYAREIHNCFPLRSKTASTSLTARLFVRCCLACRNLTGKNGFLGAVLSGAGPSVLVFLDPRKLVASHIAGKGFRAEILLTSMTPRGARTSLRRPRIQT